MLMIFCGVLNAGGLAIIEFILTQSLENIGLVAACVGAAIVIGPVALIQFITGILNLRVRPYAMNLATSIISMIPVTPAWPFSLPVGFWAYRWFTHQPKTAKRGQDRPHFGATTLMFLRESRWAKILGVANGVGAVLIVSAFAVLKLGYYPTELRYRVVDKSVTHEELRAAIQNRLTPPSKIGDIRQDELDRPTGLAIKSWQRFRSQVEQELSVPEVPQLVWLSAAEGRPGSDGPEESDLPLPKLSVPIVSGLSSPSLRREERRLGAAAIPIGEPFELLSDFVVRVVDGEAGGPQLIVELTARGRQALESRLVGKESVGGLGLIVDGLVEGIAPLELVSPKRVIFQLSTASDLTPDGITAGIRGPSLPSPLELLE